MLGTRSVHPLAVIAFLAAAVSLLFYFFEFGSSGRASVSTYAESLEVARVLSGEPSRVVRVEAQGDLASRSSPTETPDRECLIKVVDDHGKALAGALVRASTSKDTFEVGRSDTDGMVEWVPYPGEEYRLSAKLSGFRTHSRAVGSEFLQSELGRAIEIRMTLGSGSLRGHLVDGEARAIREAGVRVIARPARGFPSWGKDARAVLPYSIECEGVGIALTDSGGSFEIEGLDAETEYEVLAAGRGWCSPQPTKARCGTLAVVPMAALYGAHLQVQRSTPNEEHEGHEISALTSSWFAAPSDCIDLTEPALLGLVPGWVHPRDASRSMLWEKPLFFLKEKSVGAELGPFDFHLQLVGYRSHRIELHLPRITDRLETLDLHPEPLPMRPRGSLRLRIDGLDRLPPSAGMGGRIGEALLLPRDGGAELGFPIVQGKCDGMLIGGIPEGEYELRVRYSASLPKANPSPVPICIEEGVTDFSVSAPPFGWIDIHVSDGADPEPVSGYIGYRVIRYHPSGATDQTVGSRDFGKFVVGPLPPGTYGVECRVAFSRFSGVPAWKSAMPRRIEVRAGEGAAAVVECAR
jgi:hypothetical protein